MGSWIDSKIVVYIGRFTFGLGGENLAVACNTYASSWFKGQALNMAFGFQLAVVRVGSAVSLMILGPIYEVFLPDECELDLISTTAVTELTTHMSTTPVYIDTSPNLTTSIMTTLSTQSDINCEEEENKAIGMALAVASSSVILSLFGSFVAALLDKRRSSVLGHHLEEQPKVDNKYYISPSTKHT